MMKTPNYDDFWDLEDMIPKKKTYSAKPAPAARTETVEIVELGEPEKNASEPISPKKEAAQAQPLLLEYCPKNSLIKNVKIYKWTTKYSYYDRFCRDAEFLCDKTAPECEQVPFFSYMPQYSQMNRAQLNYYLWMREEIRNRRFPDADQTYIDLLLYEIIYFSDKGDVDAAISMLCDIWENYREAYHRLDVLLSDWICDMCLIHQKNPPLGRLSALGKVIGRNASLVEFYSDNGAASLLTFCSNYDYRKSKAITQENREIFDKYMLKALAAVIDATDIKGRLKKATVTRDAYVGALCAPSVKRKITVEYLSYAKSFEMKYLIGDAMRYTENKIRSLLGIKSRISCGKLPEHIIFAIGGCFRNIRADGDGPAVKLPEYEKKYEPVTHGFTLEGASRIEQDSWETTERLVETFDETEEEVVEGISADTFCESDDAQCADPADIWEKYRPFLRAVMLKDQAAERESAKALGSSPDGVADEINELAADELGDVILEDDGGIYVIIEDYLDDVTLLIGD